MSDGRVTSRSGFMTGACKGKDPETTQGRREYQYQTRYRNHFCGQITPVNDTQVGGRLVHKTIHTSLKLISPSCEHFIRNVNFVPEGILPSPGVGQCFLSGAFKELELGKHIFSNRSNVWSPEWLQAADRGLSQPGRLPCGLVWRAGRQLASCRHRAWGSWSSIQLT